MTNEEARLVARETVHETLQTLGLDVDDPGQMQRDFAFVRAWRTSTETVKRQTLIVSVGVVIAGILGLIWTSIKGH